MMDNIIKNYRIGQGSVVEGEGFRAGILVCDIGNSNERGYRRAYIKIYSEERVREKWFNPEEDIPLKMGAYFRIVCGRKHRGREITICFNFQGNCTITEYNERDRTAE